MGEDRTSSTQHRFGNKVASVTSPIMYRNNLKSSLFCLLLGVSVAVSVNVNGVTIPLRDGVYVVADYFFPDEVGQYPTILEVTPYGRNSFNSFRYEWEHWLSNGYAFIVADSRGQGDSTGVFQYLRTEANDTYDILEWIVQQPWSNGKVAMRGSSYTGANQWFAAKSGSPHLYCIVPDCGAETSPLLNSPAYHSGIFHYEWGLSWVSSLSDSGVNGSTVLDWEALLQHRPVCTADEVVYGKSLRLYKEFLDHEIGDEYWRDIELDRVEFQNIRIPSLAFTGWFDGTLPGTIANFQAMKRYSSSPDDQFLIIGPWAHYNAPDGGYNFITGEPMLSIGDMVLPESAAVPGLNITTAFYDWCLKGGSSPPVQSSVMVYLTGSHQWLALSEYPPDGIRSRFFYLSSTGAANGIHGNGKLLSEPTADEPADEILHDPFNPFKTYFKDLDGTYKTVISSLPTNISNFLDRNDILVYVSDPLPDALTILGNVQLDLYASTDALDADFFAVLEDVSPDGVAIKLGPRESGLARARFRNGFDEEIPVEPDVPFQIRINMYDMGHTFLQGHKLRLSIMCSMYHRTFPNPGTGNSIAQNTEEPRIARNKVFHNSLQPSALVLPVL